MIKGIERVSPMIHFSLRHVDIILHGIRQDAPPMMIAVDYEIIVDTDEDDRRQDSPPDPNVRKYGTISNTVAKAVELRGQDQKGQHESLLHVRDKNTGRHPQRRRIETCASESTAWAASDGSPCAQAWAARIAVTTIRAAAIAWTWCM